MLSLKMHVGYEGSDHCCKKMTLPDYVGDAFFLQCRHLYNQGSFSLFE